MRLARDVLAGFAALPETRLDRAAAGVRPMILAPHPDDESLGCGGLIAAACAAGRPPLVVILTDGAASHPGSRAWPPRRLARLRRAEALAAVTLLGLPAERLSFLGFPDTALPRAGTAFDRAVAKLAALAQAEGCGAIIGPWEHDPHCDHQAGAVMARAVAERAVLPWASYPVWGWLLPEDAMLDQPGHGGWRLDITAQLSLKAQAIAAHESQYGALITDSPDGFQLPANLLAIFARPFEVFIAS